MSLKSEYGLCMYNKFYRIGKNCWILGLQNKLAEVHTNGLFFREKLTYY